MKRSFANHSKKVKIWLGGSGNKTLVGALTTEVFRLGILQLLVRCVEDFDPTLL